MKGSGVTRCCRNATPAQLNRAKVLYLHHPKNHYITTQGSRARKKLRKTLLTNFIYSAAVLRRQACGGGGQLRPCHVWGDGLWWRMACQQHAHSTREFFQFFTFAYFFAFSCKRKLAEGDEEWDFLFKFSQTQPPPPSEEEKNAINH